MSLVSSTICKTPKHCESKNDVILFAIYCYKKAKIDVFLKLCMCEANMQFLNILYIFGISMNWILKQFFLESRFWKFEIKKHDF